MTILTIPDTVEFESKDINEKHVHSHVYVRDVPACPMMFSAQSRCEGIPDWDGPDYQYCIFTTLWYDDGSTFECTHLDFSPGDHGWETQQAYCRQRLPITKMRVDYFFEHKKGKVEFRDFSIEACPPRQRPQKRVVLLGDSNTITLYLAPQFRVDACLTKSLAAARPGLTVDVENAGVGGDCLKWVLERKRYERDLLTLDQIDVILISFAGNDANRYGPEAFFAYYRQLITRLRADFPGIRIIAQTGTYIDYPRHYDEDINTKMKPYYDAVRGLSGEVDGVLDIWQITKAEIESGNWDLRYRSSPIGKLILDGRFDAGRENDPAWFSNPHHNPACNRIIAKAQCEYLISNKML